MNEYLPDRRQLLAIGVVTAACVALLAAFGVVGAIADESFGVFTKEPVEQYDEKPYVGFIAHVTWFLWVIGASVAAFAAYVLRQRASAAREARFFVLAALLSVALLSDDFALIHEKVTPKLGLPEQVLQAGYALGLVALLVRFWPIVRRHDVSMVLGAGAVWGFAVASDVVQDSLGSFGHVIEDGSKLLGTALWAAFLVRAGARGVLAYRPSDAEAPTELVP